MPIVEGNSFAPNNKLVSPGVFTREIDQSTQLAQGIANIGAVVVSPFPKGPGFTPTLVDSENTLVEVFGYPDGTFYGPYTALEYLKEKGFVTVCRVGGLTGYKQKYPFVIYAESGEYQRNEDSGWTYPSSSYISLPIELQNFKEFLMKSGSANIISVNPTGGGSYEYICGFTASVPSILTFRDIPGIGNLSDVVRTKGSTYYYSNTITGSLKIKFVFNFTHSNNTLSTSEELIGNYTQSLTALTSNSTVYTSSATNPLFYWKFTGNYPFNGIDLIAATASYRSNTCSNAWYLEALATGSFGAYNSTFTPNTDVSYDNCTGQWTVNSGKYLVLAVLHDTRNASLDSNLQLPGFSGSKLEVNGTFGNSIPLEYNLHITSSQGAIYGKYNISLNPASTKFITNVFGKDPTVGNPDTYDGTSKREVAYLYSIFENSINSVVSEPYKWRIVGKAIPDADKFLGEPLNFTDEYSLDPTKGDSEFSLKNASTPWILSQKISPFNGGDPTRYRLFRVHTLSDGTNTNTQFKIEISNVKLAGTVPGSKYGSFTLTVRKFSDTDKKPVILQQFNNLNLDPNSSNYIARRIGDRYNYIDNNGKILEFGEFENNSKYIRVEMAENVWPETAVPYGFEAYVTPINSSIGYWVPKMAYTKASVYGLSPGKYPSGVNFDDAPEGADDELRSLYPTSSLNIGTARDNRQYFAPIPDFEAAKSTGQNTIFALDDNISYGGVGTGSLLSGNNIIPAEYDAAKESIYVKMRKFVLGFQGGFDGQSPTIPINTGKDISPGNTQGLDCTTIKSPGSVAYYQCINALSNADEWDFNMIVSPGIIHEHHPHITNKIVEMCETRQDCFYIVDLYVDDGNPSSGQIDHVVRLASEFDSSYAASYYPWIRIKDIYTNKLVTVPPSVVLPSIFAASDKVSGEWWAVAGLNRGGISIAHSVTDRTTHVERDILYSGKVNPIASFPGQGVAIWGQKTLQNENSARNRINVRRLLIEIKKFIASASKYLVFENNTAEVRNQFLSIVNPYLRSVQQRAGLYAFEVVMDDSNNTPDIIDQNILYGQIYIQPTRTSEMILIDFNVMPTGASFGNNV